MKKIIIALLLFVSVQSFGQKISDMQFYNGSTDGVYLPTLVNGVNRKMLVADLSRGKLDSITVSNDSIYYWKNQGTRYFAGYIAGGGGGGAAYLPGYGLLLSSTTFRIDTALAATRARVQKGIDSLGNIISALTTTNISEGSNLYWTNSRFDTRLATKTTTDLAEGTNLYWTNSRFDTRFGLKTTDNLTEGSTNLYYTNARARGAISLTTTGSGAATYNSTTGVINVPTGGGGSTETFGNDYTRTGDSVFLRGVWVNIKDYGAVGDGSTNNVNAIRAALATGKNVFIPEGIFYVSTVIEVTTVGQIIMGTGEKSVIKYTGNDRALWLHANRSRVTQLKFIGPGKAAGVTFNSGIFLYDAVGCVVDNCYFEGFSGVSEINGGGAIFAAFIGTSNTDGARIVNNYFKDNNSAVAISSRGEYVIVANNTFGSNTVAVYLAGGNATVANNVIHNNTYGVKTINGVNSAHSIIANNLINHNTYPLWIENVDHGLGLDISHNMVYFGTLKFINANNIKLNGGHYDQIDSVVIDNSIHLERNGVWWGTTLGGSPISVVTTIRNGGKDFQVVGDVRPDASTPTNWMKQQYADTVALFGPIYHTGTLPTSASTSDKVLVKDATTGQFKERDQSDIGSGGLSGDLMVSLTDGATISVDASLGVSVGATYKVTLGGNRTIANPTGLTDGQILRFKLKQDGTGTRTVTWDTKYIFSTDTPAPTLSTAAGAVDLLSFVYDATDDKLYVTGTNVGH